MKDVLAGLEPRSLWGHFSRIASIPRPSKQEERISAWVRAVAGEHGWPVDSDRVGNLVIRVPASPGHEGAETVILQAHLDMVCEKNRDTSHDFTRDPLRLKIDGDWVMATGTTLGADNGIGIAAALATASDPSVVHGPLELLFTVDEETSLTGAHGLDGSMLQGRTLLNLDSEEDGKLFVGCAGGADTYLFLEPARCARTAETHTFRIEVGGLRGGHSGINIHENRGNALKLIGRLLAATVDAGIDLELADLRGGSMTNAIPRESVATLALPDDDLDRFRGVVAGMVEAFRTELRGIDDGLEIRIEPDESPAQVLQRADRDRLLDLLAVLPQGLLGMSTDLPCLVETSNNVAVANGEDGRIRIVTSTRSSVQPTLDAVLASIRAAGNLAVAQVEVHDRYPGWKPDMGSRTLAIVRDVYREVWEHEPEVTAIHAGLECGLLGERVPGLDMISLGPQIEGAHSPDERVQISSVARFWTALVRVLARFAG